MTTTSVSAATSTVISHPPYNIHGVQDYKPLIEYLQSKNYSDSTIEKITHKNVLNLLSKVL